MRHLLVFVLFASPALALCLAAFLELRSDASRFARAWKLTPIAFGLAVYLLSFVSSDLPARITLWGVDTTSADTGVMIFAVVSCSGAFFNYSRRASSVLVALAGLVVEWLLVFIGRHPNY